MRLLFLFFIFSSCRPSFSQKIDSLHTAKNCYWLNEAEKEMIYELNCLRSNPQSYLKYIEPLYKNAAEKLKKYGKGPANYSLTYSSKFQNGKEVKTVDTNWHFRSEEEAKALKLLIKELKALKPLSVLKPDSGIYKAACAHAADQYAHKWELLHTGSDGSMPWDRITKFSPKMKTGNENMAGNSGIATPRDFVLQLLIDSGIPGYGHRYNMLDRNWTHVACKQNFDTKFKGMTYWIQNFGQSK